MRWDDLFDDLESQLELGMSAEETDILAEEERLRLARLGLRDRIAAIASGAPGSNRELRITLCDGSMIRFRPTAHGRDWFQGDIVDGGDRLRSGILPVPAIAAVSLDADQVQASLRVTVATSVLSDRLGLAFVLRDLCRRRLAVELWLQAAPGSRERSRVHGTIDRVGRDHLDVAVHDVDRLRRTTDVGEYRVIPLDAIVLVKT
jgi:hypothetical protein